MTSDPDTATTTSDPFPGTFPENFDLDQIIADVDSGKEEWLDQSLFAGVSVEAAEEWGEEHGFDSIIVLDMHEDSPAIGGPGRTLKLRALNGVVQSAHSTG